MRPAWWWGVVLGVAMLAVLGVTSRNADVPPVSHPLPRPAAPVLAERHVAAFLARHGARRSRADRVAAHVVRQAGRQGTDPSLVTAVLSVENPDLMASATSMAGAVGLMQVMPFWTDHLPARRLCGTDLMDDAVNLCYGIYVLKTNLAERKTVAGALLSYNGCRSFASPCGKYPSVVLRRQLALQRTLGTKKANP